MSIKTLSKKMLAIVAAGAMTMGLAMPTSVFAAEGDTATKVTEAYISKTFNREVAKDETFSFTATQVAGVLRMLLFRILAFQALKQELQHKELKFHSQQVGQMLVNTNIQ